MTTNMRPVLLVETLPLMNNATYGATGGGGIVGLTFCFQRSTNKTFIPDYTEIFSSLKCTLYISFLFNYVWISSLPYIIIVLFPFSHWKQGIIELMAISSLLALWFVVRQIAVPPVGLSAGRSFVFRCSISMICTPDFTVIPTSLKCTWYLYIFFFFYALIIYLPCHCSICFLFLLRAGIVELGFFRLWWYRELPLRRLLVPLVLSAWWSPVSSD